MMLITRSAPITNYNERAATDGRWSKKTEERRSKIENEKIALWSEDSNTPETEPPPPEVMGGREESSTKKRSLEFEGQKL